MGDPNDDSDNLVLKDEQDAQVGKGSRGDVTILLTIVVNDRQYCGKLEKGAVLEAIGSGFEPAVCLSNDVETNECLDNNGGCWQDKAANVTACKQLGRGRCKINNGGCFNNYLDHSDCTSFGRWGSISGVQVQIVVIYGLGNIMTQYIPLDSQNEVLSHTNEDRT